MSVTLSLSRLSPSERSRITAECTVKPNASQFSSAPIPIRCYETTPDGNIIVPLGWATRYLVAGNPYVAACVCEQRNAWDATPAEYTKELYNPSTDPKKWRDQGVVFDTLVECLGKYGSAFLAASTGFGKTTIGASLICQLGVRTVILCHLDIVKKQWVDEIQKNAPGLSVGILKGNELKTDVVVMGIEKASTLSASALSSIGFVIVDEAHIATTKAFSKTLFRFSPAYILGLSATPFRADGLESMLHVYFGSGKDFVVRQEVKPFVVHKVITPFAPTVKYMVSMGKKTLDWNEIINSLAYNKERQELIASICLKEPTHRILVLSARTEECNALTCILRESNESVSQLTGNSKVDADLLASRIIVASFKKAGVGFDDSTRTMLVMASDCKHPEQYEGRLRTINCVIYDLVDKYSTLENHWRNYRVGWYKKRGATIDSLRMIHGDDGWVSVEGEKEKDGEKKEIAPSISFLRP